MPDTLVEWRQCRELVSLCEELNWQYRPIAEALFTTHRHLRRNWSALRRCGTLRVFEGRVWPDRVDLRRSKLIDSVAV